MSLFTPCCGIFPTACLADDKMEFLGGHIGDDWRTFGSLLDVTTNRMDMIEMDLPVHDTAKLAFEMLKVCIGHLKISEFNAISTLNIVNIFQDSS